MDSSQRVRAILSFVHAADAGSFAAAARALGISSAAVSQNVAGLEKAMGVRLMNRTTRTLNLTEEGATFLRHARVALQALDQATDAVSAHRLEPSGRVRISSGVGFGREQLAPALPALLERHPGLSVEVDFDDRRVDLVQEGYDLALRGGHISDSSLIARPVCRFHLVLVASPEYLACAGVPRTPQALASHRLLVRRFLGGGTSPWSFSTGHGERITLDIRAAVLTMSSPEVLAQMALAGAGVAELGLHHVWEHLQAGRLKLLLPDTHHPGDYEMTLQYPHRALVAPRVRVTVDHLLAHFSRLEALHVPLQAARAFAA
jgi:DNA-binding transcriptional LysR family regulator